MEEAEFTPYKCKAGFLNKTEQQVYERLVEAVPAMLVFAQVSMQQLFRINRFTKAGNLQLKEIGKKSVDFLICRAGDSSIVAAIELSGPKQDAEKPSAMDEKKIGALSSAGIPLIIVKCEPVPNVLELRRVLAPHIVRRQKFEADRIRRVK